MPTMQDQTVSSTSLPERFPSRRPWVNVLSHLDPKYGGLSSAVPALSSAVASTGIPINLTGFCREDERYVPSVNSAVTVSFAPLTRADWFKQSNVGQEFRETVDRAQGIHIHGLWDHSTALSAYLARIKRKPYVISAHGMLERWALRNKRLKKAIYATLVERKNLRHAKCLHALTRSEVADYRRFGLDNPVAIIPNGVSIPEGVSSDAFTNRFPEVRGKRLILFLGRIHYKKGLDCLCEAWAQVSAKWAQAHLVLAGPDFEGTRRRIDSQIQALGIQDRVTFTGMLAGPLKWSAIAAAEGFVLPSRSEGLSVSVLEAMGMGIPVIISAQCNLPEVNIHNCGYVIQPNANELESAVDRLLKIPAREAAVMAANGRELVASRYSWHSVGQKMAAVYQWVAGGPLPTDVEIDFQTNL